MLALARDVSPVRDRDSVKFLQVEAAIAGYLQDLDTADRQEGAAVEARAAARRLISQLDPETGELIRRRSLDTTSAGTLRQNELRDTADDEGYAEPNLWTGIGRARSGAGAAIVGERRLGRPTAPRMARIWAPGDGDRG